MMTLGIRLRQALVSSLMGLSTATLLCGVALWSGPAQADDLPPTTIPIVACGTTICGGTCNGAGSGGSCPATLVGSTTKLSCTDIAKDSCQNAEGNLCKCGVSQSDPAKCACQ